MIVVDLERSASAAIQSQAAGSRLIRGQRRNKRVSNRFLTWAGRSRNFGAWVDRIELLKVSMFTMC